MRVRNRQRMGRVVQVGIIVPVCVFVAACHGGAGDGGVPEAVGPGVIGNGSVAVPSADVVLLRDANLDPAEKLIVSEGYDGALILQFEEAQSSFVTAVQEVAKRLSVEFRRISEATPTEVTKRREELEYLSGKQLPDMNAFYVVEVADPQQALAVYRELKGMRGIERLSPRTKVAPTSLANTPDYSGMNGSMPLSNVQGYLHPLNTHGGLNVVAAWQRGVRGQGVWLVDNEPGFYFGHQDLNFRQSTFIGSPACSETSANPQCPALVAHGAAMVGIMGAVENGRGVTGAASSADLRGIGGGAGALNNLTDGTGAQLPPGTVFTVIYGVPGAQTPNGFCDGSGRDACLPVAADALFHAAIEQATAAGITVIDAAGNGSISLDQDAAYYAWQRNLNRVETSAILVGASYGRFGRAKAPFSNWGRQVALFGWGAGVVTTSYHPNGPTPQQPCSPITNPPNSYSWNGTTAPLPPNSDAQSCFTDSSGGTSAATAMVAASAALLQSHAKQQMTLAGRSVHTRYVMAPRIKQLLVDSGVAQTGNDGNIGRQPDVGEALNLFDTFWSRVRSQYPELINGTELTQARLLQLRQQEGIGLECGRADIRRHVIVGNHDPSCPDLELWPTGNYIAKTLDFDGDGRADLVSAKNGEWKLDLSSLPSTTGAADNFGSWDRTIAFPRINGQWVWPYTEDMNSDGRTDIVVYDKEHATWSIKFTTRSLLEGTPWSGWDRIIDYSTTGVADTRDMDPWRSQYCRPHPGDYNGDGLVDIAQACSDGVWRMDYNDRNFWNGVTRGTWDQSFQYLDAARLAAAPGWAYLTNAVDYFSDRQVAMFFKVPDSLPEEGRMMGVWWPFDPRDRWDNPTARFGGNNVVPLFLKHITIRGNSLFAFKNFSTGEWMMEDLWFNPQLPLRSLAPDRVYGQLGCHPVTGDFDGDDREDRAVFCPDGWRIAYTGTPFAAMIGSDLLRRMPLGYTMNEFVLPGRSYSGGISYRQVQDLIQLQQSVNPSQPPDIPIDMVTMGVR